MALPGRRDGRVVEDDRRLVDVGEHGGRARRRRAQDGDGAQEARQGLRAPQGIRGSEFCNGEIDALLSAFGIERSVSRPGNPCDNAVVESANRVLKRELVRGRAIASVERLRAELFDWVNWYNNCRLHSTLGYMTPVWFREAGLILS